MARTVPLPKIIAGGVIVIGVVVAAVIGHSIASSNSIAVGDCVVTSPSTLTGWDIKKTDCGSAGSGLGTEKVVSVQNGANGECDPGQTTFQDDPSSKTYCLTDDMFGS